MKTTGINVSPEILDKLRDLKNQIKAKSIREVIETLISNRGDYLKKRAEEFERKYGKDSEEEIKQSLKTIEENIETMAERISGNFGFILNKLGIKLNELESKKVKEDLAVSI